MGVFYGGGVTHATAYCTHTSRGLSVQVTDLKRLVSSEITYNVLIGHESLVTHSLTH